MVIIVIIGVFSLSLFRSSATLFRVELRTAADAAAFAGASALCSRDDCWLDARAVAIEFLPN